MKKHTGKIIILAIVVVLGGAFWYAGQASEKANQGITITANVKGNPDAAVELVKYSDFECPACAVASPVVDTLLESYGDEIRFEYRHFPLISIHALAIPAARAAEAAGQQGAFFPMHDLLFENQRSWSTAPNPTALFIAYAEQLELDVALFRRHLGASVIEDHIRSQFGEAQALGLTGTPTFLLNGQRMSFQSYEEMVSQVEAAVRGDSATTTVPAAAAIDLEFGI